MISLILSVSEGIVGVVFLITGYFQILKNRYT